MQIFELTQKSKLNEYDPSRSPPGTPNYATGVGPGVKPQMTVTPSTTANASAPPTVNQPTPASATAGPALANPNYGTGVGPGVKPQMTATPTVQSSPTANASSTPLATPSSTPNYATGVGPGVKSQMTATPTAQGSSAITPAAAPAAAPSQPTYNVPLANVPATNTAMPSNMSTTGNPVAQPATAPAGIDPQLAAAGKVGLTAAPGRKANIGGAIANAMMKHNANQTGLGFMLPKDPDNEVYVDRNGQITVGGKPYDAKNPEHQRAAGNITIKGQPYNGANPEHRAAYMAFKNTAGRGGADTVKIDKDGKVTVLGQPFNPANPAHVQAYRQHVLGSAVKATPPPAPQATPAATQQRPAAQQPPAAATSSPGVSQALIKLGYTPQQAAAMIQKIPPGTNEQNAIKLALAGKLNESLSWSRGFDPSRTLLKKIRQI